MAVFKPNIQSLLLFDPAESRSTVASFSESVPLGNTGNPVSVFLLSEIRNANHVHNQTIIKTIQDLLVQEIRTKEPPLTEAVFEEALHIINRHLPAVMRSAEEKTLHDLSLVAGIVSGNTIHFSQVGTTTLLLIQGGKITDITDHRVDQPVNPLKVFREITTGKLEEQSVLFISTSNFLDYFSQEKIRRTVEEHSDDSIPAAFEEYLAQAPLSASFAAITVAHVHTSPAKVEDYISETQARPATTVPNNQSLDDLLKREEQTEHIMSPKVWPFIKNALRMLPVKISYAYKKYILRKPTRISPIITEKKTQSTHEPTQKVYTPQQISSRMTLQKVSVFASRVSRSVSGALSRILRKIPKRKRDTDQKVHMGPDITPRQKKTHSGNILTWFAGLPRNKKILVLIIVLMVGIFSQSIVFAGIRSERANREAQEQEQRQIIENAMSEIDAAILYGDDNRIREAVASLQSQLESIDTKTYKELADLTQQALQEAEQKLQRIREVAAPELLADLSPSTEGRTAVALEASGGTLFSLDPGGNNIIALTQSDATIRLMSTNEAIPQYLTPTDNGLFVLTQDFELFRVTETSTTAQTVSFGGSDESYNVADTASYLGRLYFIDISQNQVLVGNRFAGGIGTPTPWLDAAINMQQARSISIDGLVYLGFQDGTVRKFLRGSEETFALATLIEPITDLRKIFVRENDDTLYLLDAGLQRVMKFNKNNGSLIEQIRFTGLSSAIDDFAIQVDTNSLYILSGNAVYKTDLTQQ